jgi:ABC-2 type transport system ATP-binding protein
MKAVELENVRKTIDTFTIGPIDISIDAGSVVGIVGNNGAGKSTLFRLMVGLVKCEAGDIRLVGYDVKKDAVPLKRETAYVSQTVKDQGSFTLNELARLHRIVYGDWSNALFQRYVDLFQLPLDKRLDTLSVGMQKKAMLALQLSRGSRLLLLDEPYAGVDLTGQHILDEEIVAYMERGEGQTVVFASHSGDEIKRMADYIWLIHDGQHVGFYEKDSLQRSWGRIWLHEPLSRGQDVPGVVRVEASGTELVTDRMHDTLTALNPYVAHSQSMDLRDIMAELLRQKD